MSFRAEGEESRRLEWTRCLPSASLGAGFACACMVDVCESRCRVVHALVHRRASGRAKSPCDRACGQGGWATRVRQDVAGRLGLLAPGWKDFAMHLRPNFRQTRGELTPARRQRRLGTERFAPSMVCKLTQRRHPTWRRCSLDRLEVL